MKKRLILTGIAIITIVLIIVTITTVNSIRISNTVKALHSGEMAVDDTYFKFADEPIKYKYKKVTHGMYRNRSENGLVNTVILEGYEKYYAEVRSDTYVYHIRIPKYTYHFVKKHVKELETMPVYGIRNNKKDTVKYYTIINNKVYKVSVWENKK